MEKALIKMIEKTNLEWEKIELIRDIKRPRPNDFIYNMFDSVDYRLEERLNSNSNIAYGLAKLDNNSVVVIANNRNGRVNAMVKPEEFNEIIEVIKKINESGKYIPIISLIDTPGAYFGYDGDLKGQAKSIGECIKNMFLAEVPIITLITGEGGSGGALATGIGNKNFMLENAVYSVINPEGCYNIFRKYIKDPAEAASWLKLSAKSALEFGCIDEIIEEPYGGANKNPKATFDLVKRRLTKELKILSKKTKNEVIEERYKKFREKGIVTNVDNYQYKKITNNGKHYNNTSARYISKILFDKFNEFKEDSYLITTNPLNFPGYKHKLEEGQENTGIISSVLTGKAKLNGNEVVAALMDFNHVGGTLGCSEGEKITRSIEYAINNNKPFIGFWQSGGARIQEGLYSLMQMAKVEAALIKLREKGIPYISILNNKVYAGVLVSLGMHGETIGIKNTMIGFAGPRIIEEYTDAKKEDIINAQKIETAYDEGYVKHLVKLDDLKQKIHSILN